MAVLLKRILWYRVKDKSTDTNIPNRNSYSSPIDITDAIDFNAIRGLEIKNNVMVMKLKNSLASVINDIPYNKYVDDGAGDTVAGNIKFEEQDQIVVYAKYTEDGADIENTVWAIGGPSDKVSLKELKDDIIGFFYVIEYNVIHTQKTTAITVRCADKNYILFNRVLSKSYSKLTGKTAPEIIRELIWYSSENDEGNYPGIGDVGNPGVKYDIDARFGGQVPPTGADGGEITSIRSDGTAFPIKEMAKVWKPIYEWIDDLSSVENTNTPTELASDYLYGRKFIFFIDEENRAHWYYPTNDIDDTLEVGTDKILNVNMTRKVFDTTNMIIYNGGVDMYGTGIWFYKVDTNNLIKTLKMRVIPMTQIATNLKDNDYDSSYIPDTYREGTPPGLDKYQFPLDSQYPLTSAGTTCAFFSGDTEYNGTTKTITNDATYNDALRQLARFQGGVKASNILNKLASARWRGTVELVGKKYTTGNLVQFTDSRIGLLNQKVRITEISHNFTKSGWFTTLELEEDEAAIAGVN